MTHADLYEQLALRYRNQIPDHIRYYLHGRGITDPVIFLNQLGWNGKRITIPIRDLNGRVVFFRLAKDPEDESDSPKMLSPAGQAAELYGRERIALRPEGLVICEGEFDRLLLERHGIPAVTSTAGAAVFKRSWATELKDVRQIWICLDRDEAGRRGAERISRFIPRARVVTLPDEVGRGGDVTDFFVRLGRTRGDFIQLLCKAKRLPKPPRSLGMKPSGTEPSARPTGHDVSALKSSVRIEEVIARRVTLTNKGGYLLGRCPFHEDRTPSFAVYPESQRFHCYGCGDGGDVIDFILRAEGVGFSEALVRLRGLAA